MNTIIIIGFKASGKSTAGKALAQLCGKTFIDTDTVLERLHTQKTGLYDDCRTIFTKYGAERMREWEKQAVFQLKEQKNTVIATGGGAVLQPEIIAFLQTLGVCVFLDTALPLLQQRLSDTQSPLFAEKSIAAVHQERYHLYQQTAHLTVAVTHNVQPDALAQNIYSKISEVYRG